MFAAGSDFALCPACWIDPSAELGPASGIDGAAAALAAAANSGGEAAAGGWPERPVPVRGNFLIAADRICVLTISSLVAWG